MRNKTIAVFSLAMTLTLVNCCQPVFAEETSSVSSSTYGDSDMEVGTLIINGEGEITFSAWSGRKKSVKTVVIGSGITKLPDSAFMGFEELIAVSLPSTLTEIPYAAFLDCFKLSEINIPDSVTYIGDGAFEGCESLTGMNIPDSVKTIDEKAFEWCENLRYVTIGTSIEKISADAFSECCSLDSITISNPECVIEYSDVFDENLLTIKGYKGSTAEEIAKNYSLKFEAVDSDYSMDYSGSATALPVRGKTEEGIKWSVDKSGVLEIEGQGEMNSIPWLNVKDSITKVYYYGSVSNIPDSAFKGCSNLNDIYISDSVKTIGSGAFEGCTGLKNVYFPESVESIGSDAFSGCSSMKRIIIDNPGCSIGYSDIFENQSLAVEGYDGSTAESLAEKYSLDFYDIKSTDTVLYGDTNCDGTVDVSDSVLIMQSFANPSKFIISVKGMKNADCHNKGDGVTNADALAIQKYLLKLTEKLPD